MPERLATCCYCGRRAVLRVRDHALTCGSCGAPLRDMKRLRLDPARAMASHAPAPQPRKLPRKTRSKSRKSVWKRIGKRLEDVFEDLEDLFD